MHVELSQGVITVGFQMFSVLMAREEMGAVYQIYLLQLVFTFLWVVVVHQPLVHVIWCISPFVFVCFVV